MPLNDLYEVTIKYTHLSQQIRNVFHYHQALEFLPVGVPHSAVLADRFKVQVADKIAQAMSSDVTMTGIDARNLFDEEDFYSLPVSIVGDGGAAAESLPAFCAVAFELQTTSGRVKGAKRIAGITEGSVSDGVLTLPANITKWQAVADAIEEPIRTGNLFEDDTFFPVVIQRVRSGTPGAYNYRLPTIPAEAQFKNVIMVLLRTAITSQISRKVGKGQ